MNGKVENRMTQEAIYADFERLQKSYDEKIECLAIMCAINEKLVKILNERMYLPAGGSNPLMWSVEDVCDFVKNLPGCQEFAEEFKSHEIDGQALMLLKEDHLMHMMNMKLGPALKICSRINALFKTESPKPQE